MMFDVNTLLAASSILIGGVVWMVRLEGRINQIETLNTNTQIDVDDLRQRHEALSERLINKLSEIEKSLARIEGRLGNEGSRT